jgi:ABC-type bacteriocin/lantibiotic exporter with double-glycine peptidase domain
MNLRASLRALPLLLAAFAWSGALAGPVRGLDVPVVRQAPERCGQAALEMVLRFYGADSTALAEPARAYDPVLHGTLITDLAAAARRAGYDATLTSFGTDSLVALLAAGVPPIVLYQNGPPPLTVAHYGVVTGWDAAHDAFVLNDGGSRPRTMKRGLLEKRWRTAGSQVLVIRRRSP